MKVEHFVVARSYLVSKSSSLSSPSSIWVLLLLVGPDRRHHHDHHFNMGHHHDHCHYCSLCQFKSEYFCQINILEIRQMERLLIHLPIVIAVVVITLSFLFIVAKFHFFTETLKSHFSAFGHISHG